MNIQLNNLVTQKKRIAGQPGLFYSARLTLTQGTDGVASRPIFATIELVNGDRIHTRAQAAGIIEQWAEMARDGRMLPLDDIRIEKYTLEN